MQIHNLGLRPYQEIWDAMRAYTAARDATSEDQIWLVQHPPVYTQGQAGKPEHLLAPGDIPVIQIDRGGQITYHGPGQTVMYLLLDIRRAGIGIRALVSLIEESVIGFLQEQGIRAQSRADAPGVYVDGKKIASLGLRVRGGCTYHGVALNVDMNLEPFSRINPCGLVGMQMTQLRDLGVALDADAAGAALAARFQRIWLAKTAPSL
ncbi:Octanoyltransferase [Cardiobacterium hominis]|uniref:Octanoyltransferase n=1 Tax=Cardiobacterium hominis (strain ATCC 15826 / DSM 8339 / NCTC 10426 / 6573) TaxID=638300 RepID=C8N797_CARH6|nr:lipoyl(octanoyl) transferase LipB [Cardiobacterium hominis]EEV89518.1 lipoyl(octanoyl) transferase [Cardiobacterium hominis ATCC 15826]VEG76995.1 Octanoyltransferase [Cardiobacterium hominis]